MQEADLDLFVLLKLPDGTWGNPIALGPEINTDGNETNPYILEDGKTLYYTSTGYPGLGNGDVFVAQREEEKWANWKRPQNLGKEVNDTFRHLGFSFVRKDGKKAFFAKKDAEKGKMDIWELSFR
jgi:OmpA-OmpF porin, OOP family